VASLGLAAYLLGGVNQHAFDAQLVRQHAGIYYMVTATLMTIGILIVVLTRTAIMLGLVMFMTYVEYYFARVQNVTNFVATTALIAILALGGGVISGILSGVLSDRMKRRAPVVCVATLFMAATSFTFVVAPGDLGFWLWPLGVLFGLGYGAFSSVDWALTIDALPSLKEAGKHLGLWNASTISRLLSPLYLATSSSTLLADKDI
jgi:MFS family permease